MNGGVNGAVYTIEEDHQNEGTILVGGSMTSAGVVNKTFVDGITSWDGKYWFNFGYNISRFFTNNTVYSIHSVPDYGIFVGGSISNFQSVFVNNVAFYNYTSKQWSKKIFFFFLFFLFYFFILFFYFSLFFFILK